MRLEIVHTMASPAAQPTLQTTAPVNNAVQGSKAKF